MRDATPWDGFRDADDDDDDEAQAHGRGGYTDEEAQLLPFELEVDDNIAESSVPARFPSSVLKWLSGPRPPQIQRIEPYFPSFQAAPINTLDRLLPRARRAIAFVVFILLWTAAFTVPLRAALPIQDAAGQNVVNLDCVDVLWHPKNGCGLDGLDCGPFSNSSFTFRCPANCLNVKVWNPHAVGSLDVNYRPLVIGGPSKYRGDSFICGAAIHAGIISDALGGCGRVIREGRYEEFTASTANGIGSIPFDSYFPLSISLASEPSITCPSDPRRFLTIISLFFTATFSMLTTATWQFFVLFIAIFCHVSFVSDPPEATYHNTSVLPDHISKFAERILPAMFCAIVIYWICVRKVLAGLEAQCEKTILWSGGIWFGALSNYTLDWIPIQRLTSHDLGQPGAKLALSIIILLLTSIVLQQIYYFRLEGRLLRYLGIYGLFLVSILVGIVIPDLQLRIHHYILALLLLPGTAIQTRPSLLYQGILLGLFINGTARWGFASVLQTPGSLRADGAFNSLRPLVTAVISASGEIENIISFSWMAPKPFLDGISVLVNDVERFRRFFSDAGTDNFTWARPVNLSLPEYFRFAFIKDGVVLDYTKAGIWFPNGTWSMIPGQ